MNSKRKIFFVCFVFTISILLFSLLYKLPSDNDLPWYLQQINSEGAWSLSNGGDSNITIAVIDGGIDFTHPDIEHSQWFNIGEIANNELDDDNNGYIDDTAGWDFHSSDNMPGYEEEDPIGYHGNLIAGIIAANSTSSLVEGIAKNVKIMNIRIFSEDGEFGSDYSIFVDAVSYAIDNGADIINLSMQDFPNTPTLEAIVKEAIDSNIPVVSITGNTNPFGTGSLSYPGAFPGVITVGATNYNLEKADYSNFGSTIKLVAPVGDSDGSDDQVILSTYKNGGYAYSTGTSLACPQVSAVIALMKSINTNISVENIKTILQETAIDLGPSGWDNNFGYGLLNASAALHECSL